MVNINNENFKKEVLDYNGTVIVDFYADWCGPCKMLSPILDEVGKDNPSIKICKVNVDNEIELARSYLVMSIPAVFVFKNGSLISNSVGLKTKSEILELVK